MTFYLRTQDGSEYFLIGDIVWMMSNIEALRSRPRLLEIVFHLGEDRKAVQRQVRALHDADRRAEHRTMMTSISMAFAKLV